MMLALVLVAAVLVPTAASALQAFDTSCPKARLDEIRQTNREYQAKGALAQIMAARCDADGKIIGLTLVRLRDGQFLEWRPAEGQDVLARKLIRGE